MNVSNLPPSIASLVDHIASLPHVIAVTLRESPTPGLDPADGPWGLGVYYRDAFDPQGLMHLEGTFAAPGDWGRIMNGGATLRVEGLQVDIHYRDIDEVRHWIEEARAGRFEIDGTSGSLAGVPSYTLAAEMALGTLLVGSLDAGVDYPERLAAEGAQHWRNRSRSSLAQANARAAGGDVEGVLSHLARAGIEMAHARLCEARRWTINEKEILERAELTHLTQLLTALKTDPVTLSQRVMQARTLLLD